MAHVRPYDQDDANDPGDCNGLSDIDGTESLAGLDSLGCLGIIHGSDEVYHLHGIGLSNELLRI